LRANQGSKRQQDCAFLAPFDITTDDQRNNKNEAENRTKNNQSANNIIPFKTILIKNNITITKQNKTNNKPIQPWMSKIAKKLQPQLLLLLVVSLFNW
jgi:hypothetical protein